MNMTLKSILFATCLCVSLSGCFKDNVLKPSISKPSLLRLSTASDWMDRDAGEAGKCVLTTKGDDLFVEGKELYVLSVRSFPVKPDGKYIVSGKFCTTAGSPEGAKLSFAVAVYDKNGNLFEGCNARPVSDSETTLLAPVKQGDRVVKVKDASKWRKSGGSGIAFNVKTDYADLPNMDMSPAVTHMEKNRDAWEITVRTPFKKDYPAGTALRQHLGSAYIYLISGKVVTDKWEEISKTFGGIGVTPSGESELKFWPGTASIKPVVFGTIGKKAGIRMKDVYIKETE